MPLPANWADGGAPFHASDENATADQVNANTTKLNSMPTILDYGAKVDGQRRQDATISSGSLNIVTCTGYNFQAADVGKTIIVGSAASSTPNQAHVTTIASLSGNNAVLTAAAGNAVSAAYVVWGTDDGAAWVAAITALTNMSNAQLLMPSGISICGQAISLAPTVGNRECFSLRGTSPATSRIICTNAGGFLSLTLPSSTQSEFDFRDLTIATAIAGATTALKVSVSGGTNALQHGVLLEHIVCEGFDSKSGYWASAIQVTGVMRPLLADVIVAGLWPSTSDYSDTSPLFLSTVGVSLNQSYGPSLHRVFVWNCFRAIQAISTVSNYPQGSYLDDCAAINCREGFYWAGPGGPPQVTIRGGYYANRDWNICLNGWRNGIVSDALSYNASNTVGGWNQSSTLATAVNTGTTPTTLTLASTAGFPAAGAVLIGSEWFTYNNLTTGAPGSGMNGTTLNNVVRAEFGTADPGTNYAIGTTVQGSTADILLIDANTIRIDNEDFEHTGSPNRINVMMQSGNQDCSVANSRFNADCYAVAISNDNTGAEVLNNSFGGDIQVLNGAPDTIYVPRPVITTPPGTGLTPVALGVVTTSCVLSYAETYQTCTLTASDNCSFAMPAKVAGQSFKLAVTMPASGSGWGYTFPGVIWVGSSAPTATATAASLDILTFQTDGANWYGSYSQGYALPTPPLYDSSAKSSKQSALASGTPFTWSSVGGTAGAYGIVFVNCINGAMDLGATAAVTWGGVTMTSLGHAYNNNSATAGWGWVFVLNGIPSGAQTISVTLTQSGKTFTGYGSSYSYTNVSSVGSLWTANGVGTSPSLAVTAANTADIVWGAISALVALSSLSLTQRQAAATGDPTFLAGDTTGLTSVTVSATETNQDWSVFGLDLR